jgi:hypothetical protein
MLNVWVQQSPAGTLVPTLRVSRELNEAFFEQEFLFDKYEYIVRVGYERQDVIVCACCALSGMRTLVLIRLSTNT